MYGYVTSGTYIFLKKLREKHPNECMLLMSNAESAQILHETKGPTLFQSPRKYEIIQSLGSLKNQGFAVCNNIPVREEGRPVFEFNFLNRLESIDDFPGFTALRLLRPLSSDTYIAVTLWDEERSYNHWKQSAAFDKSHQKSKAIASAESTSVFSGPSYISTFVVGDQDEEN